MIGVGGEGEGGQLLS